MKRIFAVAMSAVLMGMFLVSCSGEAASTSADASSTQDASASGTYSTTLADIQEKGELVIGLDDTFAPMGFRDEAGDLVGFDIDLANAVCEQLGVQATFKPIDWIPRSWHSVPVPSTAYGMECLLRRNVKSR